MTESDIDEALVKIEKGLWKYCRIQEQVYEVDVATNREFQKAYNVFYRVRRNTEWQEHYYQVMQQAKATKLGFSEALLELRKRTGRLETSFASKLVATLCPERPVIDKFVLEHFGLSLPHFYQADREKKAVQLYDTLTLKYREFMSMPLADVICDRFKAKYPWAAITDLKKVDLVLWQTRSSEAS